MNRTWPTREEWAAKAEHAVRTVCYTNQRVGWDPLDWITEDQFLDARLLVDAIVKAARSEINRRVRQGINLEATLDCRRQLNAANVSSKSLYLQTDTLARDWGRIAEAADAMGVAPEQVARLSEISAGMLQRRDAAAQANLAAAIEREIAKRNTDAGWADELERRASIEAGPLVTYSRA